MLIKVKVYPSSKENEIIEKDSDSFEVRVKAPPKMGLANREVVQTLSLYFKVPVSRIRMIKGFTERNKIFEIMGD
jgi:hypothetical protein